MFNYSFSSRFVTIDIHVCIRSLPRSASIPTR